MAGDWLKMEKVTVRKPEVLAIGAALGVHPDHAFGMCFRFWSWCDDHMIDGNARSVTDALVDALVERSGFASALISVGWLQARNGSLVVPNFDRHLSESAKKRSLSAQRVAKHKKRKGNADGVTSALPREEKRREEVTTNVVTKKKEPLSFVRPTVDDVRAYCQERSNSVDPESFVDFYASKGWKVGSEPMKDWKACVRTWEKRDGNSGTGITRNSAGAQSLFSREQQREQEQLGVIAGWASSRTVSGG